MRLPVAARTPWVAAAARADVALYAAVAATPTPALDRAMCAVSRAADHSRVWLATAALLALARGGPGRRAAATGLLGVGMTSAIVNAALKPALRRARPARDVHGVPVARHVPMPVSRSLPSGHAASAFAFAAGAADVLGREAAPLRALAALVAYSRVHVGVHYPGDVALGAVVGSAVARAVARHAPWRGRG